MSPKNRVTIQHIADRANVSKSTVSRVLNDAVPVAADKEAAVLAAMADLNYRPNIFARGLAGGQSMTVGVLTHNIGSPFYDAIMGGIISSLAGSAYSPIFADGQWQLAAEERALHTLLDRRIDGLILVGGNLTREAVQKIEEDIPVIIAAREIPELSNRCISIDNFQAAYQATQFLIDAGHRRIAHIAGMAGHPDARRRQDGYIQALVDAGIGFNEKLLVEGNFIHQAGVLAVETLLAQGQSFSAIFAANDQMAMGARLALFRRGIRVPDDISLIGFDDQPGSAYLTPPLSTVRQPAVEIGEVAAQAMLKRLRDEPVTLPTLVAELIIRESVARLR